MMSESYKRKWEINQTLEELGGKVKGEWGCRWDPYGYADRRGSKIRLHAAEFRKVILLPLL